MSDTEAPNDPVAVLRRWEDSGAVWRLLGQSSGEVTVGLFTCDGGEEVSRITSADPSLVDFVNTEPPRHPGEVS